MPNGPLWGPPLGVLWRRGSESNRRPRLCRPLHDHSATSPENKTGKADFPRMFDGAGNEARTRDLNLGKVALYQLSYSRPRTENYRKAPVPGQGARGG